MRMTATVNYTTHRGHSVSLYNVDYASLPDVMRRLYQARIRATAHDRADIESQVGAVETHPDTGRLIWWATS